MCGIAGYYSTTLDRTANAEELVAEIVKSQLSRGPDHQAVERLPGRSTTCIFGHDRLSIIDLSNAANQPMWDAERTHCIVYNGEIYNYIELREELKSIGCSFHTQSDTEVILEAFKTWGTQAFERFNGMFAAAIYRTEDSRLWLFRDRFGVKPLHYYQSASAVVFASTGTAIAKWFNLSPNIEYVSHGLKSWVYEDESSISPYQCLDSVLAGHYVEISSSGPNGRLELKSKPYYLLHERVAALQERLASLALPQLVQEVLERLESAVRLRLRSDVPVGVSLSGGLDSSTLAQILSEQHAEVVGFTFGSPQDSKSEGPLVQALQQLMKMPVDYVQPNQSEMVEAFWDCLKAQDAPFPGFSIVAQYLVFKAARARGVKVLVGGQGGDELFMGYHKFQVFRLMELQQQKRYVEALVFGVGLCRMVISEAKGATEYVQAIRRYRNKSGLPVSLCLPESSPLDMGYNPSMPLTERQMMDATRFSLPTLLRYEDRNSMGNSVESRLPFMDYRVAELGFALPSSVKLRNGYGKWILREAMKNRIPEKIRAARFKRGFDVNDPGWIEAGLGESIRESLHSNKGRISGVLPAGIQIDEHFSDERLKTPGNSLSESISLLWLASRL
jgi:asparagine synthase (glutamine-hydrolysing)